MKHIQWFAGLFFLFLLVACGDNGQESVSAIKPEGHLLGKQATSSIYEDVAMGDLELLDNTGRDLLQDSTSSEYKRVYGRSTAPLYPVYFAFDSKTIGDDQLKNLNASTRHLKAQPAINIIIEGNTDSRGTNEYNMALGEFRALAVKRYLINNGIDDSRISTTSYGFHRPLYYGENEEAWAKNRRADLVIIKN